MGFFAEFSTWLNALLATYIGDNTARIAGALEPAIVTLGVVYIMIWGYLQLTGQIEEPFVAGIKRILMLALILGVSLHLWLYNALIVDTFFQAPAQLAAAAIGAYDSVTIVDTIINNGAEIAELLLTKAGVFDGEISYYFAAYAVYLVVGLTAIYTIFLLALSRIALAVLLAVGPLFFALLLFDNTKKLFSAWLAQLTNYALITILTVLIAALMLHILSVATAQAVSLSGQIQIAHAVRVCLSAGLTFLVMRQVLPMAASLSGGVALATFGVMTMAIAWTLGRGSRRVGQLRQSAADYGRGLGDDVPPRNASLSRKAGHYTRRGYQRVVTRPNQIRA
jgi:type IV secretion system protein VirB6